MNAALTVFGLILPAMAVVRVVMHPDARAGRAHRRYVAAQLDHCGGRCTTADQARAAATCPCGCGNPPGQHNPIRFPRQRTPQEN